ncbi:MAG: peptidoglycan-associated outer membrane lipoprotein precursor [Lysobacterales bacterium]
MNTILRITAASALLASLALAGCATTSPGYGNGGYNSGYSNASCYDCGTVQSIENVGRTPNATGAVLGGLVGAAATREIAKDHTNSSAQANRAAVAGAVAGAVVGNAIQNRAGTGYNIVVRTSDGRILTAMQDDLGAIRVGSYVEVRNGRAYLR